MLLVDVPYLTPQGFSECFLSQLKDGPCCMKPLEGTCTLELTFVINFTTFYQNQHTVSISTKIKNSVYRYKLYTIEGMDNTMHGIPYMEWQHFPFFSLKPMPED